MRISVDIYRMTDRRCNQCKPVRVADDFVLDQRGQDLEGDEHASTLPAPDVDGGLALEEGANLLQLAAARGRVVEEVGQLGAVGLDVGGRVLGQTRIALQNEQLVFRPQGLAHRIHMRWEMSGGHLEPPDL